MRRKYHQTSSLRSQLVPVGLGICVGGALLGGATAPSTHAQATPSAGYEAAKMEKIERENQELRKRLEALEHLAQKEGIMASGEAPKSMPVAALSSINISGFVQASYFYNTKEPRDGKSDAYLWNTTHNSFSINKVKLTLASGTVDPDKWDAGFRASFIWGEDAQNLNTGSGSQTVTNASGFPVGVQKASSSGLETLREAYVELNAPLGTGLNLKAGQLISLLNWESGDGGAANPNFSQGNQWWFTGNGPSAGVQAAYAFTPKVDLKLRVQNGMFAGPIDGNDAKAYVGSLGLKPIDKLWANIIGWYSKESDALTVSGGSAIGGYQVTKQLGTGFEFDYFHFDHAGAGNGDIWSVGGWMWYDFTPKAGVAFRADYIDSTDGVLGPAVRPGAGILTPDTDGTLSSLTFTFNWKPAPNIKVQPEVRWDHTSYKNGLDGVQDRITVGAGVSYLF